MKTFFTITAIDTTHCNDRSRRYETYQEAEKAAEYKVASGEKSQGAIIMQAIKVVTLKPVERPVIIQSLDV